MRWRNIVEGNEADALDPGSGREAALERRFLSCWGSAETGKFAWRRLKEAYSQRHRHYHTLQHVEECLLLLGQYATIVGWAQVPRELELALWFHDVVYVPGSRDNERRSAEAFQRLAVQAGFEPEVMDAATLLILDTKDHEVSDTPLSDVMCGCDLWILGSPSERFQEYARQVRKEYDRYADWEYRLGRKKFLREVLRRTSIYANPLFEEAFGERARRNLTGEARALSSRRWPCLAG